MSEPVEQELEAIREEARRLDDAITRNEISIGEGGPMLLGHLRRMIEIDLEQLQVLVPMREWAVRCCIDDWANEISPLNAWDDFIAGLDRFVREFASRATSALYAVWFRQFYDARPIDWDILLKLAQVAATVTSVSREGANADYWVLESRHWDAWTVREAANVTEHNHNTIEYCLRQNGELFKRVVNWEEVDQHDARGYLRYSEAGLSEAPMSENDAVLMDFEPKQHHSDYEGTTVDSNRDPSENLLYSSKGAGLANRLFQLAARDEDSTSRVADVAVLASAVPDVKRLQISEEGGAMYAENVEDIRALFRTTFQQAGFQPKVDEDGDFTWDDEVQGADASEKYLCNGVLYMTYLGEEWDLYRLEVMHSIMRPVPDDRVAELRLLIGLVNPGIAKGIAFVLIDMGEPGGGEAFFVLTVVTGVATDVVSEKMATVIPVLLRGLMEQMAPAYSAVLSGKATAEQAMATYWPGY